MAAHGGHSNAPAECAIKEEEEKTLTCDLLTLELVCNVTRGTDILPIMQFWCLCDFSLLRYEQTCMRLTM